MAYYLTSFDSLALPTGLGASGRHDLALGERAGQIVDLPGGVYDARGSELGIRRASRLTASVLIVAASSAAVRTVLDQWLAKVGKRGTLIRADDAGNQQTITARLVSVQASRQAEHIRVLPMTLTFETTSPIWSGTAHADTTALDASPKTISVTNGGNARVTNPVLTITAAGSAITALTVGVAGVSEWTWSGTLAVGKALVIDCGALAVRNDGADAYGGWARTPNHKVDDWLRIEPGGNSIVVTRTGGGTASTCRVQFADGWS